MIVSSVLLALGAFAVMQARLDLLVQHYTRAAVEAFYVAEAGLEHALSDLASDPRFERLLTGKDGIEGTTDDGAYPFRNPPTEFFPHAPFRYEVRVEPIDDDTVEVVSRGIGAGVSEREVVAPVLRSPEPDLPAAASNFMIDVELLLGDEFSLVGSEPGTPGDIPAFAVADDDVRDRIVSKLSAGGKKRIVGPHGTPSIDGRHFVDLAELAKRIELLPEALQLPEGAAGELGAGILLSRGSLLLGNASGAGLLLVQGDLVVQNHFDFTGLVLVMGDVTFEKSSSVQIDGGFLQGNPGSLLALLGTGHIRYDPEAVEAADALAPELLPRRANVAGWRERF